MGDLDAGSSGDYAAYATLLESIGVHPSWDSEEDAIVHWNI